MGPSISPSPPLIKGAIAILSQNQIPIVGYKLKFAKHRPRQIKLSPLTFIIAIRLLNSAVGLLFHLIK